jgi:hypothetical protein
MCALKQIDPKQTPQALARLESKRTAFRGSGLPLHVIPFHSLFTLASLIIVFQLDIFSRHEPFACVDRLSSWASLREGPDSHLVRSPAAKVDERGSDTTALVCWVAEADIEYLLLGKRC